MLPKGIDKYVTRHREDLTVEHSLGDAGQFILFILFMAVWITDAFIFKYSTLLNDYIPFYAVRLWLGIVVLAIAGYMAWTGMKIVFGTFREKPHVIRQGVFGVIRHPLYLSEVLLYLGLFLLNTSLASLAVIVVVFAFLHYISRYEEKVLLERYGDEYRQYMKDVPMYFPRIFSRKQPL
jgi:protein-S-isoprenylcysteine O-methyltransferase Ste14